MSRRVGKAGTTTPATSDAASDWQSLFDGKTFAGWSSVSGKGIQLDWKIEDGAIVATGGKALIATTKEYADYELEWEWQVGQGANGGVHYVWHGQTVESPYDGTLVAAPEYQIVDNDGHPNGKRPESSAGSMFSMFAPTEQTARPAGQWNQARLVVLGAEIEHWLNGKMVLRCTLGGEEWNARLAKARRSSVPEFGKPGPGRIALQSNTGIVRYRNIRIRSVEPTTAAVPAAWNIANQVKVSGFDLSVSNDGGRIAVAEGNRKTVRVFDDQFRQLHVVTREGDVHSASLSPAGDKLATSAVGGEVQVVRLSDGRLLHSLGTSGVSTAVRFSPTGGALLLRDGHSTVDGKCRWFDLSRSSAPQATFGAPIKDSPKRPSLLWGGKWRPSHAMLI
ncbi:MAG: DUF1080 domain-containing protein [Pirellulales bacterium]